MHFNDEVAISALVSGLVAAIVSGVFQLIVRFIDCELQKKRYFDSKMADEYFAALDAYAT